MEILEDFYHIIILLKLYPVALNQRTVLWQNDNGIAKWNILDFYLLYFLACHLFHLEIKFHVARILVHLVCAVSLALE